MSGERYMTPLQAARSLGWEGSSRDAMRRFKDAVFAKERQLRRQIFIRKGSTGRGVRYLITRPLMRKWLAELFDDTDRMLASVRKAHEEIDKRLTRSTLREDALLEAYQRLEARVRALEGKLQIVPNGDSKRTIFEGRGVGGESRGG